MKKDLAFRMQIFIAGSPEKVWTALTDNETSGLWWDPVRTADWKKGGQVVYDVSRGKYKIDCDILEYDPPRRLVTTFDCDAYPEHPPTRVTWEIEPVDGGSLLRLVHDEFPSHDKGLDDVCKHWPTIVATFKKLVEEPETVREASA